MPIYEYQCPQCGHVFEEWVRMGDATDVRPCPSCAAEARHIISNTAFVLKGGGWYVTDYGYRKNVSDSGDGAAPATPAAAETPQAAPGEKTPGASDAASPAAAASGPAPAPAAPAPAPAAAAPAASSGSTA